MIRPICNFPKHNCTSKYIDFHVNALYDILCCVIESINPSTITSVSDVTNIGLTHACRQRRIPQCRCVAGGDLKGREVRKPSATLTFYVTARRVDDGADVQIVVVKLQPSPLPQRRTQCAFVRHETERRVAVQLNLT